MNSAITIAVALLSGLALGCIYFSLLSWSVRRVLAANGGASSMVVSLLARWALAAVVFLAAVLRGGWPAALAALVGFLIVRVVVTSRWSAKTEKRP